jgi:serine/threonine protein kinase
MKVEKIGEGTYGTVYKANIKGTPDYVALKKIKLEVHQPTPSSSIYPLCFLPWTTPLHTSTFPPSSGFFHFRGSLVILSGPVLLRLFRLVLRCILILQTSLSLSPSPWSFLPPSRPTTQGIDLFPLAMHRAMHTRNAASARR